MALADRLVARIRTDGPLSFRDWMEACLYDPQDGYYTATDRRTGPGDDADFATSPTLHPFFGEAVAKELKLAWEFAGCPAAFRVVECGGGRGDLARAALAHADTIADFGNALRWTHVERSPQHRALQASKDPRMSWANEVPESDALVANEFLDALPFHWLIWRDDWQEIAVDHDGARFVEVERPAPPAAVAAAPDGEFEAGQRVVAMSDARHWFERETPRVRGPLLFIDYGDDAHRLWTPRRPGVVRGFSGHQLVDDVLATPGDVDLTTHVDFTALQNWAVAAGRHVSLYESQEGFLLRHGILDALNQQDRDTPEGASAYLRLRQLMLPTGLGHAFRVMRLDPGNRELPRKP